MHNNRKLCVIAKRSDGCYWFLLVCVVLVVQLVNQGQAVVVSHHLLLHFVVRVVLAVLVVHQCLLLLLPQCWHDLRDWLLWLGHRHRLDRQNRLRIEGVD